MSQEMQDRFGLDDKDEELVIEQLTWERDRDLFFAIKKLQRSLPNHPTFVNTLLEVAKQGLQPFTDFLESESDQGEVMTPEQYQECEAYWATLEPIELIPPETIAKLKPWDAIDDPGFDDSPDGQRW